MAVLLAEGVYLTSSVLKLNKYWWELRNQEQKKIICKFLAICSDELSDIFNKKPKKYELYITRQKKKLLLMSHISQWKAHFTESCKCKVLHDVLKVKSNYARFRLVLPLQSI